MQATARRLSVVSATSCARRRLIRDVRFRNMAFEHQKPLIDRVAKIPSQIRWVDQDRFVAENAIGVSPGEYLNRFGYEVIGTTIGGNAITRSTESARIHFADHSWYSDRQICYQDLRGDRRWKTIPWSDDNFMATLFELALDADEFESKLVSGEVDRILDEID